MRSVATRVLRALALACRVCAWALVALVVADALLPAGPRALLLGVNGAVTQLVPAPLRGLLVFAIPLGGAFRGDFAVLAIVLLVADWLLCRTAASLR